MKLDSMFPVVAFWYNLKTCITYGLCYIFVTGNRLQALSHAKNTFIRTTVNTLQL